MIRKNRWMNNDEDFLLIFSRSVLYSCLYYSVNKKFNMHRNGQVSFISKGDIYINKGQDINGTTEFYNYNLV
jgi:hypothetical protein